MRIKDFRYKKKNGDESDYQLVVLNEGANYLVGIDLNKLNDNEKIKLNEIMEKFDEELKPFMKAYRKFIMENIINETTDKG